VGADLKLLTALASAEANAFAARGRVPGYDRDDLAQEALVAMYLAVPKLDIGRDPKPYLRTTARRQIRKIFKSQQTQARTPHSVTGVPLPFLALDDLAYQLYAPEMFPEPTIATMPPCHPRGEEPEGYDVNEALCHNCADKFSCLVESVEHGLTEATVDDDPEVRLVRNAADAHNASALALAHEIVTARQRRRIHLRMIGRAVPEDLDVRCVVTLPPAPEEPTARIRRQVVKEPDGLPAPKVLTRSQMREAIERIRIGQPFVLDVGHVLVRTSKGSDVCVMLCEDGFHLNLNDRVYGSLSTAAKAAERILGASKGTSRPGNDYFSILRHHSTEIRDAHGNVLACRRGVRT